MSTDARKEEEGRNLMELAEKKIGQKSSFFKSLFSSSGSGGPEDAAETFQRAANAFKLAKAWGKAGDAFTRAAEVYEKAGSDYTYETATKQVEAGKMYKNGDNVSKAVASFEKAVHVYKDSARFQQAARYTKEIAELQHAAGDLEAARVAYESAADLFDGEDAKSNANTMRTQVATIAALMGDYTYAAKTFEQIAGAALENRLLRYGARDHLLRAGICHCIEDQVAAARAVERYRELDSSFKDSREEELLTKIVDAVEEADAEAFTNAVYQFDQISKLDDWKTTMLLMIKKNISEEEDDLT